MRAVAQSAPDLIILDLMLPKLDGFRVLKSLRGDGVKTPVLILTARDAEMDKVRGLKLGADDYVTKPFGLMELLARVEAVIRRARNAAVQTARHRFGQIIVDEAARTVTRAGVNVRVAPKEMELLLALIRRAGGVAKRAELMKEVWGYTDSVISRTVDTHIGELRKKLEENPSEPRHIVTVKKVGYRFAP